MAEKSSDAQLAREVEVSLPVELNREEQLKLVREFIQKTFVDKGMCADLAVHDKGDGNPHAHIMLTLRPLNSAFRCLVWVAGGGVAKSPTKKAVSFKE